MALEHGVPLIQPDKLRHPDVAATLRSWRPDLGVVAAYGRIIPPEILSLPRLGMINVHASLLGRRPMTAREFLAGHPIASGARLTGR